jgi:hypothetical protein
LELLSIHLRFKRKEYQFPQTVNHVLYFIKHQFLCGLLQSQKQRRNKHPLILHKKLNKGEKKKFFSFDALVWNWIWMVYLKDIVTIQRITIIIILKVKNPNHSKNNNIVNNKRF